MRRLLAIASTVAAALAVALPATAFAGVPAPPTPPVQPATGPGGAAHKWDDMKVVFHDDADDNLDYWTYEPRQWTGKSAKKPDRVPVTFFLHGYSATNPAVYLSWINHIVEKGNALIYPKYQANNYIPTALYTPNAISSLKSGLAWLKANGKPKLRLGDGVNVIGHSYGGAVATNVGAEAVAAGLPKPASMLLVNPFVENADYKPPADAIDPDLSGIPKGTELDCIVADIDSLTGRLGCDEIFDRIDHVKRADYLWMYSDDHGDPPLTISHVSPIIAAADDAYDFYGFWKLSDALGTCAFDDRNCAYATGGGAEQRSLGEWSDGTPVRGIDVFTKPPPCPPGTQTYGC